MSAPTARHRYWCVPSQRTRASRISVRGRNVESCEAGPIMILLARDLVPSSGIW